MGTDFVFIHVRKPKDALKLAKATEIRSHVTRQQWKQFGERSQLAVEKLLEEAERPEQDKQDKQDHVSGDLIPSDPTNSNSISFVDGVVPRPWGGLRGDPFHSYPVAWRPFLPQLVDHYLMSMAVDIPELDQLGNRGLLRTDWFPLVMSERALFLVIILLAASNYASVQRERLDMRMDLLALRCEAVQAVNEALELEHPGSISDALVGAIAKMASYEAMYGSLDNYTVHMQGLEQAVELRGGLASLGLRGLLRRIVIWIDRNGAFLNGSALHFPGETFAPGQPLPDPNPGNFLGAQ
ncbi:uncharacterized protein BJX67DRAFT_383099 [Aspergillus lucknowensis]|uniref:Transcription factor domain-containing protein n=1 Tax=Aspergillus lucknowensis TaxID=176173 RepID=A0ABR4LKP1_9EURO